MSGPTHVDAAALAAHHGRQFLAGLPARTVTSPVDLGRLRAAFGGPVPETGLEPAAVIEALVAAAEPGL
ncbi:MAG: hypothetical protein WAL50_02305, partial [Kineosporiaceae bacterium]